MDFVKCLCFVRDRLLHIGYDQYDANLVNISDGLYIKLLINRFEFNDFKSVDYDVIFFAQGANSWVSDFNGSYQINQMIRYDFASNFIGGVPATKVIGHYCFRLAGLKAIDWKKVGF